MHLNPSVPIIGEPITVLTTAIEAVAKCNCVPKVEDQTFLLLHQGAQTVCPKCNTAYTLQGVNPKTGALNINMVRLDSGPKQ